MMKITLSGANLIGNVSSAAGTKKYRAFDPSTLNELPELFSDATNEEVDRALLLAAKAFREYRVWNGSKRSQMLNSIADGLVESTKIIVERARLETGLPEARLNNEMNRTVNQIRMFSALVLEGSWVEASVDNSIPDRPGAPKPDIRRMLRPIGPVVIFGASNFPLAFSVAGGDTVSALAAGNSVVVKAHPSHPGTSELVARVMIDAINRTGGPEGTFSLVHGSSNEVGVALVMHPAATAVGFTGSFQGGRAIWEMAREREIPIPVFAEMGSLNPMFILPGKAKNEPETVARMMANAVNIGAGQFCTKPGVVILQKTDDSERLVKALFDEFAGRESQVMLNRGIYARYTESVDQVGNNSNVKIIYQGSNDGALKGRPVIARVDARTFISEPGLHDEIFGPYSLLVECSTHEEMIEVAENLQGQLSATIVGLDSELRSYCDLIAILEEKAGRIIFNEVPTGLEVCHSTQHGGPYPATTDSRFTSVGTGAIKRFARPVAYQNWPQDLLPSELKDSNPQSIRRLVDGLLEM